MSERPERPIISQRDDKLERAAFVDRVINALINPNTSRSTGVVIGITGAWGSGKSSILNLIDEKIAHDYASAVVVRFDPWLISGRNDLITQFISELIRSIRRKPTVSDRLGSTVDMLVKYGEQLSPVGGLWIPFVGPVIKATTGVLRAARKSKDSLSSLRSRLTETLATLSVPIVVLVDEVDRIEDDEIRAVAQLVRSVADFPGISYVLAYDPKRVIQALGAGVRSDQQEERGRAYLEKIVQLQLPLPVTFSDEIGRLLLAELQAMQAELGLPDNFWHVERYENLVTLLTDEIITTARDVSRLTGTFRVLAGMLRHEVDWVDLLAYCALVVKAPRVVELIQRKPDEFSDDLLSTTSAIRRMAQEKVPPAERLTSLVPEAEQRTLVTPLITFLFPTFSEHKSHKEDDRPLAMSRRRPLLTTLRLGLLPGSYPSSAIRDLLLMSSEDVANTLREAYSDQRLGELLDRLDDLYDQSDAVDHERFWLGVAIFLRKPDCEWIPSYSPMMHDVTRNFADILERVVAAMDGFIPKATSIFEQLRRNDYDELPAMWIRSHLFGHGLFGRERRHGYTCFLDAAQTKAHAESMSREWRSLHLAGKLIPCKWNLMPVYTMLDTGAWDDSCRALVDSALQGDHAVDGLTLMMYGAHYSTEKQTVARICSYDGYIERVRQRLRSTDVHESVRTALAKAESGGW